MSNKALGGGGGSFSKTSKKHVSAPVVKVKKEKKISHSELAARWQEQGGKFVESDKKVWTKADIDRARAEKEKREEEAAQAAKGQSGVATAAEGEELVVVETGPLAHELARARMASLAEKLHGLSTSDGAGSAGADDESGEALSELVECRRSQLQELELLEAMFVDEYRLVSDAQQLAAMREQLEALDEGGAADAEADARRALAAAPPLSFSLAMTVHDTRTDAARDASTSAERGGAGEGEGAGGGGDDGGPAAKLVASILLLVTFPRRYPTPDVPPRLHLEDVMICDAAAVQPADKLLESLVALDEDALVREMLGVAAALQPDACIFEAATWLAEHAFEHTRRIR